MIEDALGLYNEISKEERNMAKIEEINNRDPPPSWVAAPTSLFGESFSEVSFITQSYHNVLEIDKTLARYGNKENALSGDCLQDR